MGKEIYERTGLSGKPVRSGARKHGKERFRTLIFLDHSPKKDVRADLNISGRIESSTTINAAW